MEVDVSLKDTYLPESDIEKVRKWAEKILKELDLKDDTYLSILLCDDETIRELNKDYRNKDKPTDVLSFALLEDDEDPDDTYLGDIVISIDTARRQAKEFETTFENELKRLLVHGILHLVGYDHERGEKEAEKMFKKQEELISTI